MGDAVTAKVPVVGAAGVQMVDLPTLLAPAMTATNTNAAAMLALTARIAALEGKPAPVVRFTTAPIALGALLIGTRELTLSVPGVRTGDLIAAEPMADLPSGVVVAYVRAPADNTIELALSAVVAVAAAPAIAFSLAALRG